MERARRPWVQAAVILTTASAVGWALVAAPAGASSGLTRKDVRKIATRVFHANAAALEDTCPSGTEAAAGSCVETTTRGQASWVNANRNCGDLGRRLPTPGELVAAFSTPGITPATEITSDIYISDGSGSTFTQIMAVVTASSSIGGQADLSTVASYRCVAPMSNA